MACGAMPCNPWASSCAQHRPPMRFQGAAPPSRLIPCKPAPTPHASPAGGPPAHQPPQPAGPPPLTCGTCCHERRMPHHSSHTCPPCSHPPASRWLRNRGRKARQEGDVSRLLNASHAGMFRAGRQGRLSLGRAQEGEQAWQPRVRGLGMRSLIPWLPGTDASAHLGTQPVGHVSTCTHPKHCPKQPLPCPTASWRTRQRGGVCVGDVQREAVPGGVVPQLAGLVIQHRQQPPTLVLELQHLRPLARGCACRGGGVSQGGHGLDGRRAGRPANAGAPCPPWEADGRPPAGPAGHAQAAPARWAACRSGSTACASPRRSSSARGRGEEGAWGSQAMAGRHVA